MATDVDPSDIAFTIAPARPILTHGRVIGTGRAVLLDEVERLPEAPLDLPGGQDKRPTRHLIRHPNDPRPLPDLSRIAGASPRTLERLFRAETGLGFRQWRSKLRLLSAIESLNRGESSTSIAYSMGYSSPSAFGTTPQRFLHPGP